MSVSLSSLHSGPGWTLSAARAQGERPYQEDRLVAEPLAGGCLLAVFDGHGGEGTAELARAATAGRFPPLLETAGGNGPAALRRLFAELHALTRHEAAGATASVAYVAPPGDRACTATLGDSPILIRDASGGLVFGPDHNIRTNRAERAAAERRGGSIVEGYLVDPRDPDHGIQMARVLGDADLEAVVSREPELAEAPLGPGSFILVASDGLLEPLAAPAGEQLERIASLIERGAEAEDLVRDARRRRTGDNATAILWRRERLKTAAAP